MTNTRASREVEQMTGSKLSMSKVFIRMVSLAIVFAIAAVPAFAGDGGPSSQPDARTTIAIDAFTGLASLSLPGCGVSADVNLRGCATTMRVATDKAQGNSVCQLDRTYLSGNEQEGACAITGSNRPFAQVPSKVSTWGCNSVVVWHPSDFGAPTLRLRDAEGYVWRLTDFVLRAGNYQHTNAGDVWQMEASSVATTGLTPAGSWAVFTAGSRTLTMWITGALVSTGSCEDGVDAASFKIEITGTGVVQR